MPGYLLASSDQERIQGSRYMCSSCGLLLRDAMQTGCGHMYCNSCLGDLFLNGSSKMTCLVDQTEFLPNEVFPDKFRQREVNTFVVHCTFKEDGCIWKGEVRDLESHTNSCEFLKIQCVHPECDMQVKKSNLTEHLEKECKCRLESCGFCKRQINLNRMEMHQQKECLAYPVVCEKCSKHDTPRAKLLQHQDPIMGDCEGVQGPCPFSQIGCPKAEVLSFDRKKKHLESENTFHTTLILRHALQLSKEVEALLKRGIRFASINSHLFTNDYGIIADVLTQIQTQAAETRVLCEKCRGHSERLTALERKVATGSGSHADSRAQVSDNFQIPDQTGRVINFENRATDHEVLLVENNPTIEDTQRDIGNTTGQLDTNQEGARRLERRVASTEQTLAIRNVTFADSEECMYMTQQEFSSYDGQLLWKISDYARRRNDAVTRQRLFLSSPCFFTRPDGYKPGYKMRARLYLNGDGEGRDTHISISLVVMQGQYDALLSWPFKAMVTFILLDQDQVEHMSQPMELSSFHRPISKEYIAGGCPMFCPLSELNNYGYVRDDTMFLRIVVDTTDL